MRDIDYQKVIERCKSLTTGGKKLSVAWNGGGDEGNFQLLLNDKEVLDGDSADDMIIDLVSIELGYGGFDGNFSALGEVSFDLEQLCFEGTDTYSETEIGNQEASIQVRIPKCYWFDSLRIRVDSRGYADCDTDVQVQIAHGPKTEEHSMLEVDLSEEIGSYIESIIDGLERFDSMEMDWNWSRSEFKEEGDMLEICITSLSYYYESEKDTPIVIDLTPNEMSNETNFEFAE